MSVSDFAMKAVSGEMIDFSAYQGKVLLIVNTATGRAIKWKFTKFLVDRNGVVVGRYAPAAEPAALEEKIVKLL